MAVVWFVMGATQSQDSETVHGQTARLHTISSRFARVDALAALLDGPRARDAFLLRASMAPPWSIRVEDHAPLALMVVVRGGAWFVPEDGDPVRLQPGDVAVARGPSPYVVADAPERPPTAIILEGEKCVSVDGQPLSPAFDLGVRAWGNSGMGPDVMLIGTYLMEGELSGRLLSALPPLATVRAGDWDSSLAGVLEAELEKDEVGQSAVLDRMLDLILISALRAWFARPDAEAPGWYRAKSDPVVGHALDLLHHNPAHPWTVASLAGEVGVSRATLARRFADLVGESPMAYLANWRISLAADRLREPGATVTAVAAEVGYASPFALSAAFKRLRGMSPREHRQSLGRAALEPSLSRSG
jgi:AraC-like DNA-binding protein